MKFWMKKYGVAVALVLIIIGVVTFVSVKMLSKPDREPAKPDTDTHVIENEFSVEGKLE